MADKEKAPARKPEPELHTIEELARQVGTPPWILAGAKVHYGWGAGKQMSEAEYRRAIDRFRRSPIGGEVR